MGGRRIVSNFLFSYFTGRETNMFLPLRISKCYQWNILKNSLTVKPYCTNNAQYVFYNPKDEYTEHVEYPKIETEREISEKETTAWYAKIKRIKSVEEKLFEINVPRYWGWKCLLLKEGEIPYNSLDFTKFITRTHLIACKELPENYQQSSEISYKLVKKIKILVEDLVADNYCVRHKFKFENLDPLDEEKEFTSVLVNNLNRLILKACHEEIPILKRLQVDYAPRLETFWKFGSLCETYVPEVYPHGLPADEIPEEYLGRPSDKFIQYIGKPILQLRSENPLPPFTNPREALYLQYPVPFFEYDPFVVFGYEMVRRHVTNIPGFWPGEPREFSFLSYHHSNHIKYRPESYGESDAEETLQCQGILASFAWLMSLASYQGFTTFHDNTYPFVTQTVLTDGKDFSFVVYQLNTTELYHEDRLENPKCNICWMTPKMSLYEFVDGQFQGVNENVLKYLIQFYTNEPKKLEDMILKPYLDEKIVYIANYEDEEKRNWLENSYKHLVSNRPRHRLDKMYEAADFERIYKIMFRKIVRDKRYRPFDLKQNPYLRRLDEYVPPYIPKCLRPDAHLPKYKQRKFRKTFFPE